MLNINVLNINPEIVCALIEKAKIFHSKEEVTFGEDMPDSEYEYDWAQVLADHQDDLTYLEVRTTINDLDPAQKIDLLALMYLGRGDFEANDWSSAHKEAKARLAPNLTDYLFSKPLIASYWEQSLELLGYSCEE
ncbi:TPA: DUF3775 domain-containing protein [Legionella feeleii]